MINISLHKSKKLRSIEEYLDKHIPVSLRSIALAKSKVVFKKNDVDISRIFNTYSRSRIVMSLGSAYLVVENIDPNVIHVSSLISLYIYGPESIKIVRILDRKAGSLIARGLIYHRLIERIISRSIPCLTEVPVYDYVNGKILVGTIDALCSVGNELLILEFKSSDKEKTLLYGTIQSIIYRYLAERHTLRIYATCVLSPTRTLCTNNNVNRKVVEAMVKNYENALYSSI